MPDSQSEYDAAIADLEASRDEAPEAMRAMLDQQIALMKQVREMQRSALQNAPDLRSSRPTMTPESKAFFTPGPPAPLPVWLPDTLTRAQVTDEMMRLPEGAQIFASDDSVECRKPPASRAGIPQPHGLALWFHRSGKLKGQRFYEHGLLRWAISYHLTGGREQESFYADTEPKQHSQHGVVTCYAPGGVITRQAEYDHDVLHGWSKLWEEDGFPIQANRYERGTIVETVFPDGSQG